MNHSVTVKEEGEGLMLFKLTQNCILFLFISFLFLNLFLLFMVLALINVFSLGVCLI